MIRAFLPTDRDFTTNGEAIIRPFFANVHKVDNGDYYLEITCGIEYVDYIKANNIIVAPTPKGDQAFRIDKNIVTTRTKINFKAWHVYYDSNNYVIRDSYVENKSCAFALAHLNAATDQESPFSTSSNMTTTNSFRCVRKSLREAVQTVLDRWGGHLVRDNFSIAINASTGQDNGVIIQYRKNLKDITVTEEWGNVCTKVLPVGKDGQLLPEVFVFSEVQYDVPYTKVITFDQSGIDRAAYPSDAAYIAALVADLRAKATAYLESAQYPSINYAVEANVDRISDTGDVVQVYDERLDLNLTASVISYDYNCLTGKFDKVEFGTLGNTLSGLLGGISASVSSQVSEIEQNWNAFLEAAVEVATSEIWQGLEGGYVSISEDSIIVVDALPASSATYCLKIDKDGISRSTSGISGEFIPYITNYGAISAESVETSSLVVDEVDILGALFYAPSDEETIADEICAGYIDNSCETLVFSLPVPKSMKNVISSLSELKINARGIDGAIFPITSSGYDVLSDPDLLVTHIKNEKSLTIKIESSAPLASSGDTPITIEVISCVVDFDSL